MSELPPAIVVPGAVGTCVHRTTNMCVNWKKVDIAISCTRRLIAVMTGEVD